MNQEPWLERVTAALREPVEVSPELRDRILDRVEREQSGGSPARFRLLVPAAVVAAALVLLSLTTLRHRRAERAEPGSPTSIAFEIELASASRVTVVGDFNDWDPTETPLARAGDSGRWRTTVRLPRGLYRYAFLVDNARWLSDPRRAGPVDRDFGQPTSLLTVR